MCDKRNCWINQSKAVNKVLKRVTTLHQEEADFLGFSLSSICEHIWGFGV